MWRMLLVLIGACGPSVHGDFHGIEKETQTTLSLSADGSYTLHFDTKKGPQVTLQGHFSSYDPSLMLLSHERITVADGDTIVSSEEVQSGSLCAPLAKERDLCVSATHELQTRFDADALHITRPPFGFMASHLQRISSAF